MKYWIGRNNQQLGPFEVSEIQRMIVEGKVATSDLAWTEGMPSWAPVSQVIPGAAPVSAADLAKTQPLLGQRSPAPAPVVTPMPAAAAPVAPVEIPAAAAPVPAPTFAPPAPAAPVWTPPQAAAPPTAPAWAPQATAPAPAAPQWAPPQAAAPMAPAQYAPPAAAPPQYAPPQQQYQAQMGGPVPPNMNWIVVLLLGFIPLVGGLFSLYWVHKELSFVKQIDPKNNSLKLFYSAFGLLLVYIVLVVLGFVIGDSMAIILSLVGALCAIGAAVCVIMAVFQARASLVQYYNTVEPINLKLSAVMTFFFAVYYFQYHFQRIAEWKAGGPLRPQA